MEAVASIGAGTELTVDRSTWVMSLPTDLDAAHRCAGWLHAQERISLERR